MRYASNLLLGLSLAAMASAPLAAQELSYGGQVTASLPAGPLSSKDWLDGQLGGGAGVHMVIGFKGGHAIVPRFDYTYFKKSQDGWDRKVQLFQVGADYNYFLSGKVNEGPYAGAGIGYGSSKFERNGFGYSANDTPDTAYVAASAGWMFTRNLGAEVRYTWSKYKPELYGQKPDIGSPTLNASCIVRF